jgi:hypothetical protein
MLVYRRPLLINLFQSNTDPVLGPVLISHSI